MTVTDHARLPVTLDDIRAAAARIAPYVHRTPLLESATLKRMTGADLRLKAEHLQRSGSFKLRGALNKLLTLSEEQRCRGVVAFSSGNHAQGVALAARLTGTRATIVMPADAPRVKLEATRGYGAEIVLYDRQREDREAIARRIAAEREAVIVPPFDDPLIIAGQGTIGLEVAEDWPEIEIALVPVGGGGLISGIAIALKALRPEVRVIGVEPAVADDARQSLERGHIVRIPQPQTIADGVATQAIGRYPFAIMRRLVERIVTVSEAEILQALELILTRTKQVVEPTGALTTAAALSACLDLRDRKVMSLLCGGNLDLRVLQRLDAGSC
ncbi:threonine ammonia-lyase [Kallotenue papyrolyticum]|uniref:threonine ammonia-lyase n=1 Tax=Kallotenue papyrolyticum TaxID=1325125 RepID=UPI0004B19281|nr:threonine/serine dehydratase [Kallotenue papyrolyticum]